MTSKVKGQGRKVTWSVWQVLARKSRTKRLRDTKIGRKVAHAHAMNNKAHQFRGQNSKGSKVKVTRSTNAENGSASYLPNWKAWLLQTWFTGIGLQRATSPTSAMISKVKGRGDEVAWYVWQVLADKSRRKSPRNTKIGRKIAHPTGNNAYQFEGQRVSAMHHTQVRAL